MFMLGLIYGTPDMTAPLGTAEGSLVTEGKKVNVSNSFNLSITDLMLQAPEGHSYGSTTNTASPVCTATDSQLLRQVAGQLLPGVKEILTAWYLALTGLVQTSASWVRMLDEMPHSYVWFPIPHPRVHLGNAPYRVSPIWTSQIRKHTKSVC